MPTSPRDPYATYDRAMKALDETYRKSEATEEAWLHKSAEWVLLTFFALNSGGLLTVLNSDGRIANAEMCGTIFFIGLMFSLFTGVSGMFALGAVSAQSSAVVTHMRYYETRHENIDVEFSNDLGKLLKPRAERWMAIPITTGIITGLLALSGVVVAYLGYQPGAAANERRCAAIQKDMLSATPLRSDGPELFSALGCRPRGEGSVYAPPRKKS